MTLFPYRAYNGWRFLRESAIASIRRRQTLSLHPNLRLKCAEHWNGFLATPATAPIVRSAFSLSRALSVTIRAGERPIYGVGGSGLDIWKKRWTDAMARAAQAGDLEARHGIEREERRRNLGWRLYKALQLHGRWAQPYGYPIQLFGPWTRSEGPWSFISDALLHAHRDHIHVAK
jgi:hypothetical protein